MALLKEKEVLLLGTMHEVPKILKNSYRPLYKLAEAYQPETIYVETAMPDDELSWEYLKEGYSKYLRDIYRLSDSLRQVYPYDAAILNNLLNKETTELSKEEIKTIRKSFLYLRDVPNFRHYTFILQYGVEGPKKPTRYENYDISTKLAIALNHKKIFATDDQQTNAAFHKYWHQCEKNIPKDYEKKAKKLSSKLSRKLILPSLFGRYGIATNKWKNLQLLSELSGMTYSEGASEDCDLSIEYYNQRNQRIVKNLGTQILSSDKEKSVLVIGASHIIGVKEEFQKQFPNIKVIVIDDLK